jgi:hypothetical protein
VLPHGDEHDIGNDNKASAAEERVALNDVGQPVRVPKSMAPDLSVQTSTAARVQIPEGQRSRSNTTSPSGKVSPTGKVKTWFRSRFSRGSKSDEDNKPKDKAKSKGFIGGAALTGVESNNGSTASFTDNRSSSVRAVALAGRRRTDLSEGRSVTNTDEAVSPMSSSSDEEYFRDEARDQIGTELAPPRPIEDLAVNKSHSPVRDSKFHELM